MANYEPEEVAALLSCFIFQEKTDVEPVIPPKLREGLDAITAIADRVGRVQDAHKVPGEEFRTLKFGLVEVVYEWAKGMVWNTWPVSGVYGVLKTLVESDYLLAKK